ncbi:MAG: SEL1-like repeat protein [Nitrospirota bacterium]
MPFSIRPSVNHLQTLKSVVLKYAMEVAAAYGKVIEESSSPFYKPESQLPYSKAEIRECIELLLTEPLDARQRNSLECGNVILNDFIPDEEFNKIGKRDDALVQTLRLYSDGERDAHRLASVMAEADTPETDSFREQIIDERVDKENEATLKKNRFLRQVAAEQGDAASQFNLGLMYDTGEGVTQDYQEAVRWYRLAAAQGHANAQFNLAVMYAHGYGVVQDYQEAIRLYQALAEQGEADAQTNLASMYAHGQGVAHDYQEAARWFQLAAEQGNSLASEGLGLMYYQGQGVPQDYVKSYMWFNLAEKGGVKFGVDPRDTLAKNMTPEQIAEAQKLAREWKPKTQ